MREALEQAVKVGGTSSSKAALDARLWYTLACLHVRRQHSHAKALYVPLFRKKNPSSFGRVFASKAAQRIRIGTLEREK